MEGDFNKVYDEVEPNHGCYEVHFFKLKRHEIDNGHGTCSVGNHCSEATEDAHNDGKVAISDKICFFMETFAGTTEFSVEMDSCHGEEDCADERLHVIDWGEEDKAVTHEDSDNGKGEEFCDRGPMGETSVNNDGYDVSKREDD